MYKFVLNHPYAWDSEFHGSWGRPTQHLISTMAVITASARIHRELHQRWISARLLRGAFTLCSGRGSRAHSWFMALSCVIRHGGDKKSRSVMFVSPQDCDSGCWESSAAGREERMLPPHFGAGRRQHPCCRQRDNIFPCSAILGSDDPVIFPNAF